MDQLADSVSDIFPTGQIGKAIAQQMIESIFCAERRFPLSWAIRRIDDTLAIQVVKAIVLYVGRSEIVTFTNSRRKQRNQTQMEGVRYTEPEEPHYVALFRETKGCGGYAFPPELFGVVFPTIQISHYRWINEVALERCSYPTDAAVASFVEDASGMNLPTPHQATNHALQNEIGPHFADDKGSNFESKQPGEILIEGYRSSAISERIERHPEARKQCVDHYGPACRACGIEFEKVYGELGRGFIHVHHKSPLADATGRRPVNPISDLIPVCPNCHAMLHRHGLRTVEELRSIIRDAHKLEAPI